MNELEFVDYLWNNDKIGCCEYLIDSIQPIILKSKLSKKDYHYVISVLNLCNLIYRQNKNDELAQDIRKNTLLYYSILFNKTIDR